MEIVESIEAVRAIRWQNPSLTWGLVPTMGALHEGHLSLVRQALIDNDRVGVSIFVNPIQFNDRADLERYPRQIEQDTRMLAELGVDVIWVPSEQTMYPARFQTYVDVELMTRSLEGVARPGHMRGVTTVVSKLLHVFEPTRAYFGQKDAQQAAVIQQMVRDLAFRSEIMVCPTWREADGLAMSSRNVLLDPVERQAATVLYRALMTAQRAWLNGERNAQYLKTLMTEIIQAEPLARIDYISVADPADLIEIERQVEQGLISMAVYIGKIRLIDNITVGV
ncbi:MAG: pantoate--beta-alanine ligase [Anaerolineales bacterium]|nr:pantoate--beta-alanine ligase [Anaerolineales bacterium]